MKILNWFLFLTTLYASTSPINPVSLQTQINNVEISDIKVASSPLPEEPVKEKLNIPELISKYAEKYNVDYNEMYKIVDCETEHTFNPLIQSKSIRPDGARENSWGLAQIFLDVHTNITKEQAQDPDFALDFMAYNLSKGHYDMWKNCWALITSQ